MDTIRLLGLDAKDYEHPFDKAALKKLRVLPGFDKIVNFLLNWTFVKWHIIEMKGSHFHVTEASCPDLFKHVQKVAATLDIYDFPQIYTQWGYCINAYTTGYNENTLLVLNSGAIDILTDEELQFVIGHEMGHIKSRHVIYHTMAQFFTQIMSNIPLASELTAPVYYALMYWKRMSEFTSDRAGLLACQNKDIVLNSIIKMTGVPQKYFNNMNRNALLDEAKKFEIDLTMTDKAIKNLSIMDDSHPWAILRASELIKWMESGEYETILSNKTPVKCSSCGHHKTKESKICPICGAE
jgi:Zn-dependent protease with chaperone function